MKTRILYRLAIATMLSGIVFVACKKSSSTADNGTSATDLQTQSSDQTSISNETDAVADDANVAMGSQSSVSGASAQVSGYGQGKTIEGVQGINTPLICDGTITVDSVDNPRTITITYNGANCSATRTRTGVVVISIPKDTLWRNQGAVVTLSIQNLKITSLATGKSITINGTHTYTNVSGGSLLALYEGVAQSITHTITSSNMSITFDNNTQRTWSVARQRVWTYNSQTQNVTVSTSGMHTDGNTVGISEWGTNRFGNSFETVIVNPLVIQSGCAWQLTSGEVSVVRPDVTTTVTFGLNSTGAATGCPIGSGTYYFEVVWQASGKSYTFILPY